MPRYIAFLRGINVGGHRVKMDHLCHLFEELKFSDVSSFIASGNIIFNAGGTDIPALEKRIESHLRDALGYEARTFIRTPPELVSIAAFLPFGAGDMAAAGHTVHVALLHSALTEEICQKLLPMQTPMDEFRVNGRELYWLCRGKTTDSMLPGNFWTKTIREPSTLRNMTMIRRLADRLSS